MPKTTITVSDGEGKELFAYERLVPYYDDPFELVIEISRIKDHLPTAEVITVRVKR